MLTFKIYHFRALNNRRVFTFFEIFLFSFFFFIVARALETNVGTERFSRFIP